MQKTIQKGGECSFGCFIPANAEIGSEWSWGTFDYRYTGGSIYTISVAQMRQENKEAGVRYTWEPEKFEKYLRWKGWPLDGEYIVVAKNTFQQLCHQLDREGHLERINDPSAHVLAKWAAENQQIIAEAQDKWAKEKINNP